MRRTAPGRAHAAALEAMPTSQWAAYLTDHSGLPGPRANLELLDVVGDLAPADLLRTWAEDADEYLATCGTAGLGRLVGRVDDADAVRLRVAAEDERWRVREGVAFALQRIGDREPALLREILAAWSDGGPLVQRAAAAGVCEPRLLRDPATVAAALDVLDTATAALAALPDRAAPGPGRPHAAPGAGLLLERGRGGRPGRRCAAVRALGARPGPRRPLAGPPEPHQEPADPGRPRPPSNGCAPWSAELPPAPVMDWAGDRDVPQAPRGRPRRVLRLRGRRACAGSRPPRVAPPWSGSSRCTTTPSSSSASPPPPRTPPQPRRSAARSPRRTRPAPRRSARRRTVGAATASSGRWTSRSPLLADHRDTWGAFQADRRVDQVRDLLARRGVLPDRLRTGLDRLADRLRDGDFDDGLPPARLHGDLWSGNVMWTDRRRGAHRPCGARRAPA